MKIHNLVPGINYWRKRIVVVMLIGTATLFLEGRAFAQNKPEAGPEGVLSPAQYRPGFMQRDEACPPIFPRRTAADFLAELTPEQQNQIEQLRIRYQKALLPLRNELGEKMARLRSVSTGENVQTAAVHEIIDQIGALRTRLMKMRVEMLLDLRTLLTEKQRLQLDTRLEGRRLFRPGKGGF